MTTTDSRPLQCANVTDLMTSRREPLVGEHNSVLLGRRIVNYTLVYLLCGGFTPDQSDAAGRRSED